MEAAAKEWAREVMDTLQDAAVDGLVPLVRAKKENKCGKPTPPKTISHRARPALS